MQDFHPSASRLIFSIVPASGVLKTNRAVAKIIKFPAQNHKAMPRLLTASALFPVCSEIPAWIYVHKNKTLQIATLD